MTTSGKAADMLREEMRTNLPFSREELVGHIVKMVKACGSARFYCGHHIRETALGGHNTILPRHEYAVEQIARSEGFTVSTSYNSHGVRLMVIGI